MEGIFKFAVVMIAIASPVLVAIFMKHYFRYKADTASKLAELDLRIAKSENSLLQTRVGALQKRVEVLERVVTDSSYDLNLQIAKQ